MILPLIIPVILLSSLLNCSDAADILAFFPLNARSHFRPVYPFLLKLSERGHNVTLMSAFDATNKSSNLYAIKLESKAIIHQSSYADMVNQTRFRNWIYIQQSVFDYCQFTLQQEKVINLLKSKDTKFDLIITEMWHTDSFLLLAQRFNCSVIGVSFQPMLDDYHFALRNPVTFSYMPHTFMPFTDRMTFPQRLVSSGFQILALIYYNLISLPAHQQLARTVFQEAGIDSNNSLADIRDKYLSIMLVENHYSAGHVRPYLPNIIDVAGIHMDDPKPLPQDTQDFLDSSKNGVIYVSLGSLIDPTDVQELGSKLLDIFEKSPYDVIWKWKKNVFKKIPSNVMISEWLPQLDILRHPKCRLFISHGGYHSLVEAIYFHVPVVSIPFFSDQHYNTAILEEYGMAVKVDPTSIENEIENAILKLTTNNTYRENAELHSKLFKDRPMSPMDTAIYWTEHVLRYGGTPHLKSAATDLYWFQNMGLDIAFAYFILITFIYFIFVGLNRLLYKLIFVESPERREIKKDKHE